MIVETALSILDAEGLDGLSMRRIADELDTGAASLYWHVGSKDGLLDLLFDHVIGEQQVPSPDPDRWQEQLKEVARTQRATILRHRDIVAVSLGRIPMGPHALRYSEKVLAILRAGGVPDWLAVAGPDVGPLWRYFPRRGRLLIDEGHVICPWADDCGGRGQR